MNAILPQCMRSRYDRRSGVDRRVRIDPCYIGPERRIRLERRKWLSLFSELQVQYQNTYNAFENLR